MYNFAAFLMAYSHDILYFYRENLVVGVSEVSI